MADDYVNRVEFEALKKEVEEIKDGMTSNTKLLVAIDKNVDVIINEMKNTNKIEELKIKPIEKDVENIKDNNKWLWRAVVSVAIGLIAGFIFK